jgi:hypothetical protein
MITISQIKGARGILDWTQDKLAAAASRISRSVSPVSLRETYLSRMRASGTGETNSF